jgi:O-antigen/teichoic acid export membrane protein
LATIFKDILSVATSKVAIIIFGLGSSVLLARYLGPEKNGLIAGLSVYPSLFMNIGALGIRQSTAYIVGKKGYDLEKIKAATTQIWFFTTIISIIISFTLIRYFSRSGNDLHLVFLAVLPIPFNLFNTYQSGVFLGKNQIAAFNKINWLPVFLTFLATLIFVVVFRLGVSGAMLASVLGALGMFLIMLVRNNFFSSFSINFDSKIIKSLLSLGVVYAIALLVINLNYRIDIIILDKLSTAYELGIYSKGVQVIERLWQIPMLLSTIIFARSANAKDNNEFSKKVSQLFRLSVIIIGIGCIFLMCFSHYIIVLLFGSQFEGSTQVLRLLAPGILLLTIFKVMNFDMAGRGKPWVSMKAMVPALLINITINIIVIPKYGARGASFASLVSYTVAALLFLVFYAKETDQRIRDILHFRKTDFIPIIKEVKKALKR